MGCDNHAGVWVGWRPLAPLCNCADPRVPAMVKIHDAGQYVPLKNPKTGHCYMKCPKCGMIYDPPEDVMVAKGGMNGNTL